MTAIVSQRLAQRLWPDQNVVGKRIEWPSWEGPSRPPLDIIGVCADARYRSLMADPPLLLYLPEFQNYNGTSKLVVRTLANPTGLLPALRSALASQDPNLPIFALSTMAEHVGDSLWQPRMAAGIVGSFSFLALLLAAVGLYAVVAHWMGQRTREIGIRMALGAKPRDVMHLVFRYGTGLAFGGIVPGIFVASAVARFVSAQLFGATSTDVLTMALIVVLLILVTLAACYIPARRAMWVDPMVALRHE